MIAVKTAALSTWRGLMQRRLWPVALLLILALVAVPLLLLAQPEPHQSSSLAQSEAAGDSAELVAPPLVAAASPADRERVRRVLGDRKDPFKPSNQPKRKRKADADSARTSASADAPSPSGISGGSGPGPAVVGVGGAPVPSGSPAPAPIPDRPGPARTEDRVPAGSLSVRWGSSEDEELEKLDIERLDPLPSPEEPVLVYLGLTDDANAAVFMVDAGVTVDGDGRCRPAPDDCQTFELKPGETEFIEVEQEDGEKAQFQLDLVKIHGRKAERAKAARRSGADEARATRRALRSLSQSEPDRRSDARPYTPKLELGGS